MRRETSGVASGFVVLVTCSLVISTLLAVPAVADGTIRATGVSFDGGDVVERRGNVVYLWESGSKRLGVTITTADTEGQGHYEVCVRSRSAVNNTVRELTCRPTVLTGNTTERIRFTFDRWPARLLGRQAVSVVITADTLSRDVVAKATLPVHVLREDGDLDGDGLTNSYEVEVDTNFSRADTDGDGLGDRFELNTYGTDPAKADTDGDGLTDGPEANVHGTDPTAVDTDGDELRDPLEIRVHGTNPNRVDTDGDGLGDAREIHIHGTDPNSADTDDDGLDDELEVKTHGTNPSSVDTDGDGLNDALEVYTYETNPNKVDTDGDGLEDGPEATTHETNPTDADTDGDGLEDGPEVNTHDTDPNLADTDGDGLVDGAEVVRYETNPNSADTDGDGRDDATEVSRESLLRGRTSWLLWAAVGIVLVGAAVWIVRSRGSIRVPSTVGDLRAAIRRVDGIPGSNAPNAPPERAPVVDASEPLTNEDRVLALLSEHGGRMQQSGIVEATDWSKSKVSRLLSRMADEGTVKKINVGRENVIALPGEEPERAKSPFDDEGELGRISSES